MIAKLNLDIT